MSTRPQGTLPGARPLAEGLRGEPCRSRPHRLTRDLVLETGSERLAWLRSRGSRPQPFRKPSEPPAF
jgi:hypothetical protein